MTLTEFILRNMEKILKEWEAFARTLPAARHMDTEQLRDHAAKMLKAIALDLQQGQTASEQSEKSKGNAPEPTDKTDTAATSHGTDRFTEGFGLNALVAEYRALRATVVRLWGPEVCSTDRERQLSRFNEAIDQALNESVARYSEEVTRSNELFLGVLGHDLRTPLGATLHSAQYLLQSEGLSAEQIKSAVMILKSGTRIRQLTDNLLDLTRTRLGNGICIEPKPMDLVLTCEQVAEEAQSFHPDRTVTLTATGDLQGSWDESRLYQLLSNLVENAIRHGNSHSPVNVSAVGSADEVRIAIHNAGQPIPKTELRRIFEPMRQAENRSDTSNGLGLGLYIARVIVDAHQGTIDIESSSEAGTTFTVQLPRSGGRQTRAPVAP